RFSRDWSSDVCSSDLDRAIRIEVKNVDELHALRPSPGDTVYLVDNQWENSQITLKGSGTADQPIVFRVADPKNTHFSEKSNLTRSEERRVGKEIRYRG